MSRSYGTNYPDSADNWKIHQIKGGPSRGTGRGSRKATEAQKRFLRQLGFEKVDLLDDLTRQEASDAIEVLKNNKRR